jgi:nitroreductase
MDFQKVIDHRHSIREFEKRKVPKNIIEKLISNANKAPTAKNEQNWKFYVVVNEKVLGKIINVLHEIVIREKFNFSRMESKVRIVAENFYKNLGNAPCVIFVYRQIKENAPSYQAHNDISSISCAIENLMLTATAIGLGSCWVGTFNSEKKITNLVGANKNQELVATVILGYPKKGSKILLRNKKKLKEILKLI